MKKNNDQIHKLQEAITRLSEEKQNKIEIFEAIHDGIIVFKPNCKIKHLNSQCKKLLDIDKSFDIQKDNLRLFKNKKATRALKLSKWLESVANQKSHNPQEILVWKQTPNKLESIPLLLSAKGIYNDEGKLKQLMLVIYDRTIQFVAEERQRLMQAAFDTFNGQFITNEKGYIIQANTSFYALTGTSEKQVQNLSLIQWLEKQVNLHLDPHTVFKTLLEKRFWSGEVEIYPDHETTFHAVLSISMIADEEANIEHYIVTIQNLTDIKDAHRQIEHMAFYDNLTGLANRKLAIELINQSIKTRLRNGTLSALLYINMDRFKSINDAFGRKTGDKFIARIAETLQKSLRTDDQIARLGGDEFVVIIRDDSVDREGATRNALRIANKISDLLNHHFIVDGLTLHSSARIGVKVYPNYEEVTAEQLLVKADLAVTQAKNVKNQNKIYVYEPTLTKEVKFKRGIENDLTLAHKSGNVMLYYQPLIDIKRKVYGAEALLRWNHPIHGMLPPDLFIKIAEESRQILKLGAWVLFQAFKQAKVWSHSYPDFNVSVNISPIQFREADFIENILDIMNETEVDPKNITLELTESVFISDTEAAFEKIKRLADSGFKIAIDDFGTGYSSLSYLRRLPIHELKIDKSFIDEVPNNEEDIAIIESIINLAKARNLDIVAEGVETRDQVDLLHKKDKKILIQGYVYGKPCPADEFQHKYLENNKYHLKVV